MINNYFKPTSAKLLRISLGLKTLIATISGAAYFQGSVKSAFWALVAGAVIDFVINCLGDDSKKDAQA